MKKTNLSSFKNFVDVHMIREDQNLETNPESWEKLFNQMETSNKEAGKTPGDPSSLPDWAKKALEKDLLSGKSADDRWKWLTDRVNSVLKDKEVSKIEEVSLKDGAKTPGFRLLWKEEKKETADQQDKEGTVYKVYFTDIYKGDPGIWVDRKDEGGKPGTELARGFWGQDPSGQKGILWAEDPKRTSGGGGIGDMKLIDLFAKTSLGRSVLGFLMNDEAFKKFEETGEVEFTDSPPTSSEITKKFTPDQKKTQEENIQKMKDMGHGVEEPDYSLVTGSGDYSYNPESFKLSWKDLKKALENAGIESKLNFNEWNLVGIRNTVQSKNKFPNRFTDLIVLMSPRDEKKVKIFPATTTPGVGFMYTPFRNWWMSSALKSSINPNGVAILQPGVYTYTKGKYKDKYTALLPGEVKIGRLKPSQSINGLKYTTFSPEPIEKGDFEIPIIKAEKDTSSIDSWSAGAQVLKKSDDFEEILSELDRANQNRVRYSLIDSSSLSSK